MQRTDKRALNTTEAKTLLAALFIDGFWERWIAHGVDPADLQSIRPKFKSVDRWTRGWMELAEHRAEAAARCLNGQLHSEAERSFRLSSLYYNLAQWIHPARNAEKERGYELCREAAHRADQLSAYPIKRVQLSHYGHSLDGRLCVPPQPKGCIIMLIPVDSNKEEFFTYEYDFASAGFITISFDGPGQGGTYMDSGLKASPDRWMRFVHSMIDYADAEFPVLPIHLFGTSSGASWSIYGSSHEKVTKVAAVSPAVSPAAAGDQPSVPGYFRERMNSVSEGEQVSLPPHGSFAAKPVLLFHGKKDVLVSAESMERLYHSLPGAQLVEYENEGHCCNFKLKEIRQQSLAWFGGQS